MQISPKYFGEITPNCVFYIKNIEELSIRYKSFIFPYLLNKPLNNFLCCVVCVCGGGDIISYIIQNSVFFIPRTWYVLNS